MCQFYISQNPWCWTTWGSQLDCYFIMFCGGQNRESIWRPVHKSVEVVFSPKMIIENLFDIKVFYSGWISLNTKGHYRLVARLLGPNMYKWKHELIKVVIFCSIMFYYFMQKKVSVLPHWQVVVCWLNCVVMLFHALLCTLLTT